VKSPLPLGLVLAISFSAVQALPLAAQSSSPSPSPSQRALVPPDPPVDLSGPVGDEALPSSRAKQRNPVIEPVPVPTPRDDALPIPTPTPTNPPEVSPSPPLPQPSPPELSPSVDATATISIAADKSVSISSRNGTFERVGLQPNQLVEIIVRYPLAKIGRLIVPAPLDGGEIVTSEKALVPGVDGTIRFGFRTGQQPGVYQVALLDGAQELGLQFWVLDQRPARDVPPIINPGK